ncbi:MAG: hypothetical protein ACQGVC_20865 [Myxococcota bacterium]
MKVDVRLERRPLLLLGLVFLLSLPVVTPYLRGDGIAYYAYVASAVIDGDLMFENEFKRSDPGRCARYFDEEGKPHPEVWTPTGHLENYHATGPSVLWTPFFLAAHAGVLHHNRSNEAEPIAADGYSRPYLLYSAMGTALYGFLGLLFSHALARSAVGAWPALWAVMGLWFASNLPVYMYLLPFLSHAPTVFVNSAFVWTWWRTWREPDVETPLGRSPFQWLALGALGGFAYSVYLPSVVIGVFVVFDGVALLRAWAREGAPAATWLTRLGRVGLPALLGLFIGALPHLATRMVLYGGPFATGRYGALDWSFGSWVIDTLFSSNHGLFPWHPIYAIACLGFFPLRRRNPGLAWRCAASFALAAFLVGSKPNWHGGSAFGQRYLLVLMPVFALGLAAALEAGRGFIVDRLGARRALARPLLVGSLGLLALWNAGLLLQWGLNMIPNRGTVSFAEVAKNQVTAVPARFASVLVPFLFDRSDVVEQVEREDLQEIETFESRGSICTPPER